ncbi:MAG: hypothetical protein AAFZ18_03560 [Myxococcota bacterium]
MDDVPGATPPTPPPPPPPPPTDETAPYVRGNLRPIYELTPLNLFGLFDRLDFQGDVLSIQNADFQVFQGVQVGLSQAAKMSELEGLVLNPDGAAGRNIISAGNDRLLSQQMPFRGKPSDVKFFRVGQRTKVFVPVGGNVMVPGNEVAIVTLDAEGSQIGRRSLVKVGVRPQSVEVHPAGLVFVCNQYSNYISVLDPQVDEKLQVGGQDLEIPTEYYCSDIVFTRRNPLDADVDDLFMYVSNRWRHSVLKYRVRIGRRPSDNRPDNVVATLLEEISDVGLNPYRMTVNDQQTAVYAVSNKGGFVARIDVQSDTTRVLAVNSPTADVIAIESKIFVPTTMPDRGQVTDVGGAQVPDELRAGPAVMTGVDERPHVVHPGEIFDTTNSYLFEDARNGIWQIDGSFANRFYYTDNSSGEANFQANQKVLDGGLPWGITRNAAGTRIWVTLSGSQGVQEFAVAAGAQISLQPTGRTLKTNHRPLAVALDEANNLLYVSTYMGETLDVFDLDLDQEDPIQQIDLGYAAPEFPASGMEVGELFFNDTTFSNNGDKSCVSCHYDEMDIDGIGFANGTGTPTGYKQIKPQHNLARTGPWFWNGGMGNGNYTSTAFSFQTRTNCDMVQFAFTEGPASDPNVRVGDLFNFTDEPNLERLRDELDDGDPLAVFLDANIPLVDNDVCRPERPVVQGTPANAAAIAEQNAIQKSIVAELIRRKTVDVIGEDRIGQLGFPDGIERTQLAFFIDLFSNGEIRLPPNPMQQMWRNGHLSRGDVAELERGREVFNNVANCSRCHDPGNNFMDGKNHGSGADYVERFVARYQNDDRIISSIGSFAEAMTQGLTGSQPDREINVHVEPIESFTPICAVLESCLTFKDPIAAQNNFDEETRRLDLHIAVNLGDPERQFIPSNAPGEPSVNTPSLRGVWSMGPGLLHHTHAKNVAQAILPPGHAALEEGEVGYGIDRFGEVDVHGETRNLSVEDVRALVKYVNSIE